MFRAVRIFSDKNRLHFYGLHFSICVQKLRSVYRPKNYFQHIYYLPLKCSTLFMKNMNLEYFMLYFFPLRKWHTTTNTTRVKHA